MKVIDDWPAFTLGMMTDDEWAAWKSIRLTTVASGSINWELEKE